MTGWEEAGGAAEVSGAGAFQEAEEVLGEEEPAADGDQKIISQTFLHG